MDEEKKPKRRYCTVVAFWILGLCNNYGYVVMISAAMDILKEFHTSDKKVEFNRACNYFGTGIILLADIVPTILVKCIAPFLPLKIFIRMTVVVLLNVTGFVLVGIDFKDWLVILGVVCISLSCGLGETTLLGYMVFFPTYNVISTWSSGTGGAGIFGAGTYMALTYSGLSSGTSILIMLVVPALQAVAFFLLVEHPLRGEITVDENIPTVADELNFREKMKVLLPLLKYYMAPFGLVYLSEYFINQGLYELLYFPDTFIDHYEQYRTYQFLYQTGVFISRSSMNIVRIDYLWTIAGLQFFNVVFFMLEVYFGFITYLVIMFFIIVWEGLLGGASYVNTYRRIASEFPKREKQFCMAVNGIADAIMITLAGIIAAPVHNFLCTLEKNYNY